eukprot:TRINITY_DN172_c0_g1_i1.p2 TRINITY_DN172_c0_g1~~TRINITY_DN172_c0_g1_i1.p2  ORF type:complete len:446 (+),score=41.67 TRINITY_DN172_c0_g1_i1:2798-4135(+)
MLYGRQRRFDLCCYFIFNGKCAIQLTKIYQAMNSSATQNPLLTEGKVLTANMAAKAESAFEKYETVEMSEKSTGFLGQGAFGRVILMKNKETSQLVAVKAIDKTSVRGPLMKEVDIHKRLIHDNIIRLYETIESKNHILLVMEYAPYGDLYHLLQKKSRFTEHEASVYFTQVCNALHFLHKYKLAHRDLKPENLLLMSPHKLKLCDFGCCAQCMEERKTLCGTIEYIAPEVLRRTAYNEKADIWSLGILLYEMVHGYTPFKATTQHVIFTNILENKFKFSPEVKDDLKDLIKMMLNAEFKERPSIEEIMEHSWIKRIQKERFLATEMESVKGLSPVKVPSTCSTMKATRETDSQSHVLNANELITDDFSEVPRHILYDYPEYENGLQKISEKLKQFHISSTTKVVNLKPPKKTQKKDKIKKRVKKTTSFSLLSLFFPTLDDNGGL